ERFWNDAMKAFFPGGKDDPDLVLIEVAGETVEYWDGPGSWIGKAAAFAVARVTGDDEALGENRIVDLRSGVTREPPGGRSSQPACAGMASQSSLAPSSSRTGARSSASNGTSSRQPTLTHTKGPPITSKSARLKVVVPQLRQKQCSIVPLPKR